MAVAPESSYSEGNHEELVRGLRVLIVDDDASLVELFVELLGERGLVVRGETDAQRALTLLETQTFDVVVADIEMPGLRGPDLMAAIHRVNSRQLVILMTAFGSFEMAVQTLRAGAVDFLAKPIPIEGLVLAIARAVRERSMHREVVRLQSILGESEPADFVAKSPVMRKVLEIARRAARSKAVVLLTGESGTGKSSVAKFIHQASTRAAGPFITLNCAALPVSLAEAELFGAKKGAYTGANEDRDGLFVRANDGTLFLDEIGELSLELQPKLLEVLETGRLRPLGATREITTEARLVAATNASLEEAVDNRTFRADLFFRLNVIRIEIPPLRERREDLPLLVDALVRRAAKRSGRRVTGVASDAQRLLFDHHWPGNVRELANVIERAVVLSEHDCLLADDFVIDRRESAGEGEGFLEQAATRRLSLETVERRYIKRVLESVDGVKLEAAKILGIDRRTLYRKLDAADD